MCFYITIGIFNVCLSWTLSGFFVLFYHISRAGEWHHKSEITVILGTEKQFVQQHYYRAKQAMLNHQNNIYSTSL